MVNIDQHTATVSFVVEVFLKFDLSTVTPNDLWSKIPEHPKSLAKGLFTHVQNLSNYIEEEAFWAYLKNDPKLPLDDLWPQIPEHLYCPPTRWSLYQSIMKSIKAYLRSIF